MTYQLIESQSVAFPVEVQCAVLGASRSAFYAWRAGRSHQVSDGERELEQLARERFEAHKSRYGSRRLCAELRRCSPAQIGRHRVRKWMKRGGLVAIQPRSFVPRTTDSRRTRQASPNLLAGRAVERVNEAWASDITYLPMANGSFSYLATWVDVRSRRVVGWHADTHMRSEIVEKALKKALFDRKAAEGLLVHSDRGSQYASRTFRALLVEKKITQSMSDRDNPYDNALAESFFSRLKAECVRKKRFLSIDELRNDLFDYINCYYNTVRLHSSLGYQSPDDFEKSTVQIS